MQTSGPFEAPGDYIREKFYQAVHSLATESGDIRERLFSAALAITPLILDRDVPEYLRDDVKRLRSDLSRYPAENDGEGNIEATLRKLNAEESREIAERFFSLYLRILNVAPI